MIVHSIEQLAPLHDKIVLWKDGLQGLQALPGGGYETRQEAVLSLVDQADRDHLVDAFGPLLIHTNDQPISTVQAGWKSYAFCTGPGYVDVAVPDFVFCGWPEVGIDDFDETCRSLAAAGARPADLPVAGWIGSCHTHPVRSVLKQLGHAHPDLLDVQEVKWIRDPSEKRLSSIAANALSLPEQAARWSALVDVEGAGYSGRFKLLLHSGRPVLLQDRPWREWFWDRLVPMVHYIPVRRDLSDLVDRARWVRNNPLEAQQIGHAGQELAQRLLTRASALEQWARTLALAGHRSERPWAPESVQELVAPILSRLEVAGGSRGRTG